MSLCFFAPLSAGAEEKKIILEEHLNRRWTHQLLTYPFEAGKGHCAPESVTLTGPNGPLAVQLSDVALWPGTQSVKSARLSFVVEELMPLATQTYTVTYGPAPGPNAAVASDLKVVTDLEKVEMTTSKYGVRLLLGQKVYERPVQATEVPGPILAMCLSDGTWFGGSRLYGDSRVRSWSSRLTADGPVFARVETAYTYANGNVLRVTCQLAAGDYAALIDMDVAQDRRDDGWELLLGRGIKLGDATVLVGWAANVKELTVNFNPEASQPACYLNPWPGAGWFPDSPAVIRLGLESRKGELQLSVRDPGAWVKPLPLSAYGDFKKWTYEMIPVIWSGWMGKRIPLVAVSDGEVIMRMSLASGRRTWTIGEAAGGDELLETYHSRAMTAYTPYPRLNEVKEMVLDWPDGREKHPYLFMGAREIERGAQRNYPAFERARDVKKLGAILDKLGGFDLMRGVMDVAARYDVIIDSDLVSPEERKLFKAQMAYLAYLAASPLPWSIERGYCSGNPNMTVARVLNVGILGCLLRDHPKGKDWGDYAVNALRYWLQEVTSEQGQWVESSHYARVSLSEMIPFAIAARKAGYWDFFAEPKFKAMGMFYEKTLTPPDPLRRVQADLPRGITPPAVRVDPPYGRGTRGDAWGLGGLVARATAVSDPEYSRIMQWSWRECGFSEFFGHRTAGMNALYVNRNLPTQRPDWRSEYFPGLGYLLRSHVGTPQENYLLFVSHYYTIADGQIWPPDTGTIAKWFANGRPIGGVFRRIPQTSHVLLENRVLLACNWDPKVGDSPPTGYVTKASQDAFASLPGLDYVSVGFEVPEIVPHHLQMPKDAPAFPKRKKVGAPPFHWRRQLMLFGSEQPGGVNYLLLRDTVSGGQPTQWHFWTLSQKIGTSSEAANRDAFLKDKPGDKVAPLRELKGNRFTALGQFDVDLEYYIASPLDTPRYTLRYGTRGGAYGLTNFNEFQDLMHLQLPGDGCYYVAMFPRFQNEKTPEFATLCEGKVIKIAGTFGTDYGFLTDDPVEVKAEHVAFKGTAAAVQDRASGMVLALAAPGEVTYREYGLSAQIPVSLRVTPYAVVLELPEGSSGGEVQVRAPGRWSLVKGQGGIGIAQGRNGCTLTVPEGVRNISLTNEQ